MRKCVPARGNCVKQGLSSCWYFSDYYFLQDDAKVIKELLMIDVNIDIILFVWGCIGVYYHVSESAPKCDKAICHLVCGCNRGIVCTHLDGHVTNAVQLNVSGCQGRKPC